MGRRAKTLTAAQMAEVETLAAVLSADQVADYFGIGRTTFFNMIGRDPEIAERYKRGKARAIGAIAQGLIQKARSGDTASMIFYLKCQAGWRERSEFVPELPEEPTVAGQGARGLLAAHLNEIAGRLGHANPSGIQVIERRIIRAVHDEPDPPDVAR